MLFLGRPRQNPDLFLHQSAVEFAILVFPLEREAQVLERFGWVAAFSQDQAEMRDDHGVFLLLFEGLSNRGLRFGIPTEPMGASDDRRGRLAFG